MEIIYTLMKIKYQLSSSLNKKNINENISNIRLGNWENMLKEKI